MSETSTIERRPETSCRIDITGMDCGDCAKTIEASLNAMPGVQSATVNFARGSADLAYESDRVDLPALENRIKALGYGIAQPAPTSSYVFDISGMDCGDCAKTVEAGVRRLPGVAIATVNFAAGTLNVTPADGRLSQASIVAAVAQAGYGARPHTAVSTPATAWWRTRRVFETALAALLWLIGFGVEQAGAPRIASAVPFLAAMVIKPRHRVVEHGGEDGWPIFRPVSGQRSPLLISRVRPHPPR